MKLLFTACIACGARSTSPLGLCAECEDRQMHRRAADRRRSVREHVRRERRAA
jgi:uncharacterized OB-fold protein